MISLFEEIEYENLPEYVKELAKKYWTSKLLGLTAEQIKNEAYSEGYRAGRKTQLKVL